MFNKMIEIILNFFIKFFIFRIYKYYNDFLEPTQNLEYLTRIAAAVASVMPDILLTPGLKLVISLMCSGLQTVQILKHTKVPQNM